MTIEDRLIARLSDRLGQDDATTLVQALSLAGTVGTVAELLEELADASERVWYDAVTGLRTLQREAGLEQAVRWLDLGVAITGTSGAAGLRYFRESPAVLARLGDRPATGPVLEIALEMAESDANAALEFVRQGPALAAALPLDELPRWADIGLELAKADYVLCVEFLRQCPALAVVLPLDHVRSWVGFGMKLVTHNSLGKTDYFATLEFFRTSPNILEDIDARALRGLVVGLGDQLARQDPQRAVELLAEAPSLLRRLPSEEWARRVLQYGLLLAERDASATLAYLRRCPEMLALLGGAEADRAKFDEWYRSGMEVLEYSAEGGRAYFAAETRTALASVERALSGVPLRRVARALKLFVQGLCGEDVAIRAAADEGAEAGGAPRATVTDDGRTLVLPSILRRYPTAEANRRLYHVMAAHEAGHLEFGTYRLPMDRLDDLIATVAARYARGTAGSVRTLADLFTLYPQPALMRDLWTVLEDARVEAGLRREYPGLSEDLEAQARESVSTRTLTHGLSVREMVVDHLLLMTTHGRDAVPVPDQIRELVDEVWGIASALLEPGATAEDAVRRADWIYTALEAPIEPHQRTDHQAEQEPGASEGGPPSSDTQSEGYQPVSNWSHRGAMNPDLIRRSGGGADSGSDTEQPDLETRPPEVDRDAARGRQPGTDHRPRPDRLAEGDAQAREGPAAPSSLAEEVLDLPEARPVRSTAEDAAAGRFVYDEWDGAIQDYRSGWCRVREQPAEDGTTDFADDVLARHAPMVRLLRRYFETIRPEGLRRLHGCPDGEDVDLDAAIRRRIDRRAGADPSDRIYVRRERRERDVAVAFLVDLSGSTSRVIDAGARRVIDVEKEGLVLLTEALDAIGDQHAIYGYSGRGRAQVDFVVFRDFDDQGRSRAMSRIGAAAPRHQNRDGAAVRHAVRKLLERMAKVRLLVLISDGKPLDDGYAEEYALEDTKMALREARLRGVEPFCITVDRAADGYLRRMYGDVSYLIIDHIASLPERLPRIYQRLTT